MTASEQLLKNAERIQRIVGYPDIRDAINRARQENPSLAFQAQQEADGCKSNFANDSGEANAAKHRATMANAEEIKARRLRNVEIGRDGWDKVNKLARAKKLTQAEALVEVCKSDTQFANSIGFANVSSGASDGYDGDYGQKTNVVRPNYNPGDGAPSGINNNGGNQADIEAYQLPVNASPEEIAAAKSAGSKDPQKIMDALVNYTRRIQGVNTDVAEGFCWSRYPKLARQSKMTSLKLNLSQGTSRALS